MKIDAVTYGSHNPYGEDHRVSRLRENLTSGSEGEGLETGRSAPRQPFTRQVFFKMIKQHLNLAKEIQCRDYDALIGHTSIVFMRYLFLAYHCRLISDHRSFGDLFHACCEEIRDISFVEALLRILSIAEYRMKSLGALCQRTIESFFYVAMEIALNTMGLLRNRSMRFSVNPES